MSQLNEAALAYNVGALETDYPKLMTGKAEIIWQPFLDKMKENSQGADKFQICIMFPESSPVAKNIITILKAMKTEKFKKQRGVRMPIKTGNSYIQKRIDDCDTEEEQDEEREKFSFLKDMIFMTLTTKDNIFDQENVIHPSGEKIKFVDAAAIKSGSKVRVVMSPSAYTIDTENVKGINLYLSMLQVIKFGTKTFGSNDGEAANAFGVIGEKLEIPIVELDGKEDSDEEPKKETKKEEKKAEKPVEKEETKAEEPAEKEEPKAEEKKEEFNEDDDDLWG